MRVSTRLFALCVALLFGLAACSSSKGPAAAAPSTLNIRAGVNDPKDTTVAVLSYLPAEATVKVGETVKWTVTGPEPHTISLVPSGTAIPTPGSPAALALQSPKPATGSFDGTQTVSSGLGPTSKTPLTFSLSFSKAGTYTYFCAIHVVMRGTITVTTDAAKAETQSAVDKRGQEEQARFVAEGEAAKQKLITTPVEKKKNADGTTTWTVLMGVNTPHAAVLAFEPAAPAVKPGDTVQFVNNSGEPHTATFSLGVAPPQGAPELPIFMKATGKSPITLGAKGYFNSGWLFPDVPGGPPLSARTFAFVVPKAGSFTFYCALHITSGMGGSIKAT